MSGMDNENQILSSEGFSPDEKEEAKRYWSGVDVRGYVPERPWSRFIAGKIIDCSPSPPARVFEFGCNAGKNLATIRKIAPSVRVFGVDINPVAIRHAQTNGLDVAVADEQVLKIMPDGAFDVCFTVSVLDHLPEPGNVLAELGRLSRKAVFLLEPWLGEDGKVIRNFNMARNEVIDTTPYSYSWDYPRLGESFLPGWTCSIEAFPMDTNLGRYYNLYTFLSPD